LVGLASNLLSVHVLRPYPGWDSFRPKMMISAYENEGPTGARILATILNR
jgi:hypothetical protein